MHTCVHDSHGGLFAGKARQAKPCKEHATSPTEPLIHTISDRKASIGRQCQARRKYMALLYAYAAHHLHGRPLAGKARLAKACMMQPIAYTQEIHNRTNTQVPMRWQCEAGCERLSIIAGSVYYLDGKPFAGKARLAKVSLGTGSHIHKPVTTQ